ncbi:hypothetical protein ABZX93_18725 [Streptomyces sp. NPDC006632]|uniref:hypothetical protein n=1 Tax=unclassified Streptomyces TaxID=2593676 RepID=UPI002E1C538A
MSRPTTPTALGATGVYTEKVPMAWSGSCVGGCLAAVAYMGVDSIPQDTGVWLIVSALFLLLPLPRLAVPISRAIHNRISVGIRARQGEPLRIATRDRGAFLGTFAGATAVR